MSNEPRNSLLQSAWHGTLALCGIAVVLWLSVKLLETVWVGLVIIGAVILAVLLTWIGLRWWRGRHYW